MSADLTEQKSEFYYRDYYFGGGCFLLGFFFFFCFSFDFSFGEGWRSGLEQWCLSISSFQNKLRIATIVYGKDCGVHVPVLQGF